jgi:hypothetical protein
MLLLCAPLAAQAQLDLVTPFRACGVSGSTTIYD